MTSQRVFRQILEELQETSPQIRLKLPANRQSIGRQAAQITSAQQQLTLLKSEVTTLSHKCLRPLNRQRCQLLMRAMDQMIQTAENLKLLAEEYGIDPEGSISCLQSLSENDRNLPEILNQVKTLIVH